ncbi:MAG: hypothetical protein K8S14_00940 [Actinomycetia bacterium]|nr:hypothetical protein [Actinomycetes bacterium]
MEKENNRYGSVAVDVNNILGVFKKRRRCFAGSFLVILFMGLVFNFFVARDYQYRASTVMTIPTENLKFQKIISDEYPQEANSLWLIKEGKVTNGYFNHYFTAIPLEINSEEFLNDVVHNLDMDISLGHLKRLVLTEYGGNESFFIVNTFYRNPEDAKIINETVIDTYTVQKEKDFRKVYDELIGKIEGEILILEEDLSELSIEAEGYAISFNRELIDNITVGDNVNIELKSTEFLPPELENEIKRITGRYNYLRDILDNLVNNEKLYTGSIEIVSDTRVNENFTYFRNILLSIAAALVFGIVFIYIIDFIISIKNRR